MKSQDNELWELERDRQREGEEFERSGWLPLASLTKWFVVLVVFPVLVWWAFPWMSVFVRLLVERMNGGNW